MHSLTRTEDMIEDLYSDRNLLPEHKELMRMMVEQGVSDDIEHAYSIIFEEGKVFPYEYRNLQHFMIATGFREEAMIKMAFRRVRLPSGKIRVFGPFEE
jgi:hypothetical protein